jgi:23S rRNA (adenine2030-N6)-methyltransferase
MFAYRHAFHAGNHADVLKHIVLQQVMQYMMQKDKPYWVIDTHAGAGIYSLASKEAQTKGEYLQGIARLSLQDETDPAIVAYLELLTRINKDHGYACLDGQYPMYPGSPLIAEYLLRADDRLRAFELHPSDAPLLEDLFHKHKQVKVFAEDGFHALKALLPPPTKRAVILMDPPYEIKTDYDKVVQAVREGMQRFAEGVYLIWYPILPRADYRRMLDGLKKLSDKTLNVSMQVQAPNADGFGLLGSGVFMINPPWTMAATMTHTLPRLLEKLAQTPDASYSLEQGAALA